MRYIYTLLIVLFFASCEEKTDYSGLEKNADAVFLSLSKEYQLNSDGSQLFTYSQRLKLLTHASFNNMYGESFIKYDPEFQKVNVLLAETENSMGKSVVGANAINDILPKDAQRSAYYNRLREKVVSHMGTEIGAVINFDYSIDSKKEYKIGLFENIIIQNPSPARKMNIKVVVPSDVNLMYRLFNSDVKPVIKKEKDFISYVWSFKNVPTAIHQEGEPSLRSDLPRLVFSTVSIMDIKRLMSDNEMNISDRVFFDSIVGTKLKNIKKRELKYIKLQKEIVNSISLNKLNFEEASFTGRSPKKIWEDASAGMVEKAFLFREMLKSAGYDAEIVVAVPSLLKEQALNNPSVWGEFNVLISDGGKKIVLSALKNNTYDERYDLSDCELLNPISGDFIVKDSLEGNFISSRMKLKINSDKFIWGEAKVSLGGMCKREFKRNDRGYFKGFYEDVRVCVGREEMTYYIESNKNKRLVYGNCFMYEFPQYALGFNSFDIPKLNDERLTDIEIDGDIREEYEGIIVYNRRHKLLNKDVDVSEENKVGSVKISLVSRNDSLFVVRKLNIKNKIIKSVDFKDFKRLISLWDDENYRQIYFRKK